MSHNTRMETQNNNNEVFTRANVRQDVASGGVILCEKDADEFRAYKRQKKMDEINRGIAKSQPSLLGGEDVQRVCDRAVRLGQPAILLPATKLFQAQYYLGKSNVKLNCLVGGNGETTTGVKRYEARLAVRKKAQEITLCVTPSYMDCCRYSEVRKEIKVIKRAIGRSCLKVRVEKTYSLATLSRLARISCECKAQFFSVPYFDGCERLRLDLTGGCKLEVSGIRDLETYKKLLIGGVARIVTENAWEIYNAWLREACQPSFIMPPQEDEKEKSKAEEGIERVLQDVENNEHNGVAQNVYSDGKML